MAIEGAVDGAGTVRPRAPLWFTDWPDRTPHPWRRFFARMIDLAVMGWLMLLLAGFAIHLMASEAGRQNFRLWVQSRWPLASLFGLHLAALPLDALIIGLTGTSLGKWIMGVAVLNRQGRPLGVRRAFLRELDVYVFAWGLLIPGGALAMMRSGVRLAETGRTWWDALNRDVVLHRRHRVAGWLLSGLGLVLAFLASAALEQVAQRYADVAAG